MQPRMNNPAMVIPDAMNAILALAKATRNGSVPEKTLELVHLRASQINGFSFCVDYGARSAKKAGEPDERLFAVAACRQVSYFNHTVLATPRRTVTAPRLSAPSAPPPHACLFPSRPPCYHHTLATF